MPEALADTIVWDTGTHTHEAIPDEQVILRMLSRKVLPVVNPPTAKNSLSTTVPALRANS